MKSKGLINHSKETFVSPRVTQTLGFELESELLLFSGESEMQPVQTMGVEVDDRGASYYEGTWN